METNKHNSTNPNVGPDNMVAGSSSFDKFDLVKRFAIYEITNPGTPERPQPLHHSYTRLLARGFINELKALQYIQENPQQFVDKHCLIGIYIEVKRIKSFNKPDPFFDNYKF